MSQTQEDMVIKFDMHQNIQSALQLKQMRGRGRGNPHKRFVVDKFLTSKFPNINTLRITVKLASLPIPPTPPLMQNLQI